MTVNWSLPFYEDAGNGGVHEALYGTWKPYGGTLKGQNIGINTKDDSPIASAGDGHSTTSSTHDITLAPVVTATLSSLAVTMRMVLDWST